MRALVFSDLHAHPHRALATYDAGMNSRLADTLKVLGQINEYVRLHPVDAVLFCGDLFHVSPPYAEAFNHVYEAFVEMRQHATVLSIAGNHDLRQLYYNGDRNDIPFLKYQSVGHKCFDVLDDQGATVIDGVRIAGLHHQRSERLVDQLNRLPSDIGILLLHQEVLGASAGSWKMTSGLSPAYLRDRAKWIFCGHIHQPQKVDSHFIIPGAPLHVNFGDTGDRGFWILDTKADTCEMVCTKFRKFITLAPSEKPKDDGNYYRPAPLQSKPGALRLPGVGSAIDEYCAVKLGEKQIQMYATAAHQLQSEIHYEPVTPSDYILQSFEIEEFGPFESASVSSTAGLKMILGEWEDNPGKSNGSGKSSLLESLAWIIYGKVSKGLRGAEVMRRSDKKRRKACCGTATFVSPTRGKLVVTRKRTSSSTEMVVAVEGRDEISSKDVEGKKNDVQTALIQMLGVDFDFFQLMTYFGQSTATFFSDMGDADRKSLLSTLLGLGWYDLALEAAKARRSDVDAKSQLASDKSKALGEQSGVLCSEIRRNKERAADWEKTHTDEIARREGLLVDLQKSAALLAVELKQKLDALTAELDSAQDAVLRRQLGDVTSARLRFETEWKKGHARLEFELAGLRKQAEAVEVELKGVSSTDDLSVVRSEVAEARGRQQKLLVDVSQCRSVIKALQKTRDDNRRVLSGAEGLKSGTVCPTCGTAVTDGTKEQYLVHLRGETYRVEQELIVAQKACQVVESNWDKANQEVSELSARADRAQDVANKTLVLKERLAGVSDSVAAMTLKIDESLAGRSAFVESRVADLTVRHTAELDRFGEVRLSKLKGLEDVYAVKVDSMERQVSAETDTLTRLRSAVCPFEADMTRLANQLTEISQSISAADQESKKYQAEVDLWSFWVEGFGREGIPAALMQDFCVMFTDAANSILSPLNIGISVKLEPQSQLKSGESRERLNYVINTPTGESIYKQLSGGEQTRINVTSMLTLHSLASSQYKLERGLFGLLILDEVFSALDDEGCELIYQLLSQFADRAVFVISHSSSMKSLFTNVLTVRRGNDNVSKVIR